MITFKPHIDGQPTPTHRVKVTKSISGWKEGDTTVIEIMPMTGKVYSPQGKDLITGLWIDEVGKPDKRFMVQDFSNYKVFQDKAMIDEHFQEV